MVAPTSRGNVTIKSASMNDAPVINPNWLTTEADQEMAVALFRRMRHIWASETMQEVVVGDEYWPGLDKSSDEEILEVVRDSLMTIWHAACTCKMGKEDDEMAVVDPEAKVYGVSGLRIVDASAMPILPPGHPSSTICKFLSANFYYCNDANKSQMRLRRKSRTALSRLEKEY